MITKIKCEKCRHVEEIYQCDKCGDVFEERNLRYEFLAAGNIYILCKECNETINKMLGSFFNKEITNESKQKSYTTD